MSMNYIAGRRKVRLYKVVVKGEPYFVVERRCEDRITAANFDPEKAVSIKLYHDWVSKVRTAFLREK